MADLRERCPDCQVAIGEAHQEGCDVARCMLYGEQRLGHEMMGGRPIVIKMGDMFTLDVDPAGAHDCGAQVWSGRWPGEMECEAFGWWAYFAPNSDPSFVQCGPDHPDAVLDLNRLAVEARWDSEAGRYQLRGASS